MKVCAITATKNRHFCIERSLRFFLEQTYPDCIQLIYNNSCIEQSLNSSVPSNKVILINNCVSKDTGEKYTNLGEIYKDVITYIPEDVDVITFWDDDDIFLPNHIEEGVKGLLKGGKTAYKPEKSFYRTSAGVTRVSNTLEPSMFIYKDHILKYGFHEDTAAQHMKWVTPLLQSNEIFIDKDGVSTLCYNWGDNFFTWKTSGDPNNPENFKHYEKYSEDIGDQVISPLSKREVAPYYAQIQSI